MASVTGRTAESIDAILAKMVVSVRVDTNGQLIYKAKDGTETNGGPITSPSVAVDKAWPVGAIYIGVTSANPNSLLGVGTWVRYGEGKVLVSQLNNDADFGAAGDTGGEKTVTLTSAQIPAHTHPASAGNSLVPADMSITDRSSAASEGAQVAVDAGISGVDVKIAGSSHSHTITVSANTGGGGSHNNLQPFIVVYMWRRTA